MTCEQWWISDDKMLHVCNLPKGHQPECSGYSDSVELI
jgi:hypothetical protein